MMLLTNMPVRETPWWLPSLIDSPGVPVTETEMLSVVGIYHRMYEPVARHNMRVIPERALNEMRLRTEIRSCVVAFGLLLFICFSPAFAQEEDPFDSPLYHVVNTYSDDNVLALRTEPSLQTGLHIMLVPNGTMVEVVERRRDRWWYVRLLPFGQEGWILSGHGSRRWIECCRTKTDDPLPIALDEPVGFKTPTNVYCVLEDIWLRCDIKQISGAAPVKPPDCYLDWGDAFFLAPTSEEAYVICHGDTVVSDALPTLPYGKGWSEEGYTCKSEKTGLKCTNPVGHGFTLSRTNQTGF